MLLYRVQVVRAHAEGIFDMNFGLVLGKVKHGQSASTIAAQIRRSSEGHGGQPDMTDPVDDPVPVLMQMTAHDKAHA